MAQYSDMQTPCSPGGILSIHSNLQRNPSGQNGISGSAVVLL